MILTLESLGVNLLELLRYHGKLGQVEICRHRNFSDKFYWPRRQTRSGNISTQITLTVQCWSKNCWSIRQDSHEIVLNSTKHSFQIQTTLKGTMQKNNESNLFCKVNLYLQHMNHFWSQTTKHVTLLSCVAPDFWQNANTHESKHFTGSGKNYTDTERSTQTHEEHMRWRDRSILNSKKQTTNDTTLSITASTKRLPKKTHARCQC